MTLLFPLYYLLPPLAGHLEPMPVLPDLRPLMGLRYVIGGLLAEVPDALTSGMLGTVGVASLLMLLKRRSLAVAAAILVFTPVARERHVQPRLPAPWRSRSAPASSRSSSGSSSAAACSRRSSPSARTSSCSGRP